MAEFDRRPLAPMVDEAHSLAQNTRSLALSTCRKYLAVGSFDRTIAIFDVASRKVFRRFGEGHLPSRARFRGPLLRTPGFEPPMELPPDEVTVPPRVGHTATVLAVIFSPDSSLVVSGSSDTTIRIWRLETSEMLRALVGHTNAVEALAMAPDTATLASGSWDMSVIIWRTHTGERLHTLAGHSNWVLSLAFSADGGRLVSGSRDKTVRVWDPHSGQLLGVGGGDCAEFVEYVALSPDGTQLVSGYSDEATRIWCMVAAHAVRDRR